VVVDIVNVEHVRVRKTENHPPVRSNFSATATPCYIVRQMPPPARREPERGVYFRWQDYAGFWRRLLVDLIDLSLVGTVWIVSAIALVSQSPVNKGTLDIVLAINVAVFFGYFVVLKRSKFRTLGYRAGGVRIVGLNGEKPGWFSLMFRLMFILLGPLNWLCDLIFASGDECRQAIRDKFASTYVVKIGAKPAGAGNVVFRHYDLFGFALVLREIERPDREESPGDRR
jgi:uncharacterized RDD family membrane protein YckC